MGSASELDYHLLISHDLGFLKVEDFQRSTKRLTEVRKMLFAFLTSIEDQINSESKAVGKHEAKY